MMGPQGHENELHENSGLIDRINYIQSIAADQFDWYQLDNYFLSGYAEETPKFYTSVRQGFKIWIEFII